MCESNGWGGCSSRDTDVKKSERIRELKSIIACGQSDGCLVECAKKELEKLEK